jgi:exodeoxyribonuclease III
MKLMAYNIFNGAVNKLPQIIEIVNAESPDYLTLNEANTFANNGNEILKRFAQATNFSYFDLDLSGKRDYHVAIFSKYPLKTVQKLQPLDRACLVAVIDTEFGKLSIASLHLTPFTEDLRHDEINLVVDLQKQYPNKILLGDMNSLSRIDNYDENMIKEFNGIQLKKFTKEGNMRYDAIDKILSTGYYDVAVEVNKNEKYTVPTKSNLDAAHSQLRLDYIFVSKPLLDHLSFYDVIKNDLTDGASDHYPIVAELV